MFDNWTNMDSLLLVGPWRSVPDLKQAQSLSGEEEEAAQCQSGKTLKDVSTLGHCQAQARGYQRIDRRRSKTFKSITVPEEVLQEAELGASIAEHEDEDEDDEDEVEVEEYGEPWPQVLNILDKVPSDTCRSFRCPWSLEFWHRQCVEVYTYALSSERPSSCRSRLESSSFQAPFTVLTVNCLQTLEQCC